MASMKEQKRRERETGVESRLSRMVCLHEVESNFNANCNVDGSRRVYEKGFGCAKFVWKKLKARNYGRNVLVQADSFPSTEPSTYQKHIYHEIF